jgi:tetratricopeptide (TPR) repeat protein
MIAGKISALSRCAKTVIALALLAAGSTSAKADPIVDRAIISAYKQRHAHQPQQALITLNAVADKATRTGGFYAERAADYIDLKNFDAARKDCETAIKLDPKLSDAFDRRAYCHAVANEIDLAIADYTTAIKLNPKSAMPYHNRAIAYRSIGKLTEAKADMQKYLSLKPIRAEQKEHESLVQRSEQMEQTGTPQQAMAYLQDQIKFSPSASLYLHLGALQAKTGKRDEAIKSFTSAIELGKKESGPPAGRLARLSRATIYAEQKHYDQAIADATAVISQSNSKETVGAFKAEAKTEHCRALLLRGACYNSLKQFDKALADLQKALAMAPDATAAIKLRADIYNSSGKNLQKAIQDYSSVLKKNPSEEAPKRGRAECYMQLKQYKLAIKDYSEIIDRSPQAAKEAYLGRSWAYKALNDQAKAQSDLEHANQTQPE